MRQHRAGRYSGYRARGGLLNGRRIWDIGGWGNASEYIGRRWEELGRETLTKRLLCSRDLWRIGRPPQVVPLLDQAIQDRLQGLGVTNPDSLLVDRLDGELQVRPVDFKWSLETASYKQISAIALAALLDHPGSPVREAILEVCLPAQSGSSSPPMIVTCDGFFYAPASQPNRQFMDSSANHRQEFPLEPSEVVFERVDGLSFFEPLPGWPVATRLADLDRARQSLADLDGAERYYRIGAGVRGALIKFRTSLFAAEPADVDVDSALTELLQDSRVRSCQNIVEILGKLIDRRAERQRRLRQVWRCPYTFRNLLTDLEERGIRIPEGEEGRTERERWGQIHRAVAADHRGMVNKLGLQLVAEGRSEASAISELESRTLEFEGRARAQARRLLREELGD